MGACCLSRSARATCPSSSRCRGACMGATANARSWSRIANARAVQQAGGIQGDALQRPPRGYDANHPHIEDLKRKSFYVMIEAPAAEALKPVAEQHELVMAHGNGPQVGLLALQASAYKDVEAYPLDPAPGERPSGAFTGIGKAFRDQGFVEVARRSKIRPIDRAAPASMIVKVPIRYAKVTMLKASNTRKLWFSISRAA